MIRLHSCLAVCMLIELTGCVSATPAFSGGRLTPENRAAFHMGASSRIPLGDLAPENNPQDLAQQWLALAQSGGVIPVGMARYGLSPEMDLEVTIAGASIRSALRAALELEPGGFNHWPRVQLMGGLGATGGIVQDNDGDAHHYGVDVPLVIGIDWASLYEFWAGVRGGIERFGGDLGASGTTPQSDFSGFAWRTGLVAGMALGFRNFHGILELTAYYESFHTQLENQDATFSGISLVPAFALRWRI